jgi:putative aldouronate transport system permease protein
MLRRIRKRDRFKKQLPLHLMLVPAIILALIYRYFPMFGVVMAFQNFNPGLGFLRSPLIGLGNFEYVTALPDTGRVLWNTIYISFLKIVADNIAPLIVALMLNEVGKTFFKRIFQTMVYLPHFLSWVVLGGILIDVLSPRTGLVNEFITALGGNPVFFLGDNDWFPFTLIITDVWKTFGFGTIVYLAALAGIDPNLYEVAEIDGAGRWKQTLHITLPSIVPILILLATLSLQQVLEAGFDQVFNLYSPQVYRSGDIIDTYVYRLGLVQAQFGVAAAVGLFKSVVSMIFITLSYTLAYRLANYRIF